MEQNPRKPKAGNFPGEFRYQPRRGTRGIISKPEDRRWILSRSQRPLSMHKRALWAYIRARMGQAASRRPGGYIFIAILPDRFFTKDRPRRRVDAEHHFEGRSIATRKLNSANGKIIWSQHSYLFPLLCEGLSGSHFIAALSFELQLCKLFSNLTPSSYRPFICESEYMIYFCCLASFGSVLLKWIHDGRCWLDHGRHRDAAYLCRYHSLNNLHGHHPSRSLSPGL